MQNHLGHRPQLRMIVMSLIVLGATSVYAQENLILRPNQPTGNDANGFNFRQWAWETPQTACASRSKFRGFGDGAGTSTYQTEWSGFPANYIAKELKVNWQGQYGGQYGGGNDGSMEFKIEYSLGGGGGWTTLEENIQNHPTTLTTIANHWATVGSLPPDQLASDISIRATFKVTTTNPPIVVQTQVGGSMGVCDIQVVTGPPILEVSPNPVSRGQTATFEIIGAPGGTVSLWAYDGHARTTSTGATTWPGTIVEGGVATVRVVVSGQTFNLSKSLAVAPRLFTLAPVAPQQVSNGTLITLPTPPTNPPGTLGYMRIDNAYPYVPDEVLDQGPNHGYKYVTSISNDTDYDYQISPQLENLSSPFAAANCGQSGFILASVLLSNTWEHEAGTALGHYQQYVTAQNATNVGDDLEDNVAPPDTTLQEFIDEIDDRIAALENIITPATVSEAACNSTVNNDTSCTFRGYVNFFPYQPCP